MSSSIKPSELADIATDAALSVGSALLSAFAQPGKVEYKRNFHDPVTVHDRRAEAAIREKLFSALPDSLLLGEEENQLIDSAGKVQQLSAPARLRNSGERVIWLVDPIDGTSNFASGLDWWCVSIGAVRGDDVVAGVVYQPTTQRVYRADETGAYLNGNPIRVNQAAPHETLVATDFPADRHAGIAGGTELLETLVGGSRSVRRLGSTALHLALVAEGILGATLGLGTHPWDIAAGVALVRAAGGHFVGLDSQYAPHAAGAHNYPNYAAAGSAQTLELALGAIRKLSGNAGRS